MFNLHKLGLVLVIGGFAAICASIFASTDPVTSNAFLSTITDTSTRGESETTDQLRRWSRGYYKQPSPSTTETTPLLPLPTATPTTAPQQQIVPTSVPPTAVPQATNTPVPSTSTTLNIIGVVQLGEGSGYQDSGDVNLSNGQAVTVVCQAQTLSIDKNGNDEWEPLCTGPNDDDHVSITCPSSLSEIATNSLTRNIVCGNATVTTSSPSTNTNTSSGQTSPTSEPTSVLPQPSPTPIAPAAGATSGGTVSNPNGTCIEARTAGQVIQDMTIGPCGDIGIDVLAPNVTIRNVTIRQSATNIRVYRTSGTIIENSRFENPAADGDGYVQQIGVDKSSGVTIRNNTLICSGSSCDQEDAIGVYQSSNVTITGNSITGGRSESGCGIMADAGATWLTASGNTIQDQENCGIGIANGTDHIVSGNNIAGYGNVGIYVWNQYGGSCSRITISNNTVDGSNKWWNGGNCSQLTITGNNFDDN